MRSVLFRGTTQRAVETASDTAERLPLGFLIFFVVFVSVWLLGAIYLLSRWVRFGKHGVFLGGRLLYEGPTIRMYTRLKRRVTLAVLASTNTRRPIALKVESRSFLAAGRQILSVSDAAARRLGDLLDEAHGLAVHDRMLRNHHVGSVRVLWLRCTVYARTEDSLVGFRLRGGATCSIPDEHYELFVGSYREALQAADAASTR